jgi:HK97 family phage portal protein
MNDFITQIDAGMHYTGEVQASGVAYPEERFFDAMTFGTRSDSGESVNPQTALGHAPVWQAIQILAGDVGQLPWHKMRWVEKKDRFYQERDEDHPLDWLIGYQPNRFQTPSVWRETMMAWALGWGNGISAVMRNEKGERELWPLLPDRTSYLDDDRHGYLITSRLSNDKTISLRPDEVFHIRGLTSNGFWGLSAVQTCKNVIGHGLALQRHGNSTFKNGAKLGGVLQSDGNPPSPEVRDRYRAEWESLHSGASNAGRIAMLYGGMKFQPISMSNDDAQWLEARRLDRELVASLFNLPAHKLNALENSAVRANLEESNKDYFNTSLARWLNRFNEEAERKLLSERERRSKEHSFMWRLEQFLQGDTAKLMQALGQGVVNEIMTRNEARERIGLNPSDDPGADELKNPAINPTPAGGDAGGEEMPDDKAKTLAKSLMRSQVSALLETEANTIRKTCEGRGNFVKWVGNYYENFAKTAQNFLDLPCQVALSSGFSAADWRAAIYDHARQSQTSLLSMAGLADKASLPEIGSEAADAIRGQVDQLTAAILGEQANGQ